MSRADYQLRYAVMGMLGSFWSRSVTDATKDQARAVVSLAANAAGLQRSETPMRKLVSSRRAVVENVTVTYLEGEFAYTGPNPHNFWRSSYVVEGVSYPVVRLEPEGYQGEPRYAVPIPAGLSPVVIATRQADRSLVCGIDFESSPGYITLRESPGDLFFAGSFTVLSGYQDLPLPYNYPLHLNGSPRGHAFVAAYYRGAGSVASFERAAAQAAGLLVLEQDDKLLHTRQLTATIVRYVFAVGGAEDVDYPHAPLVTGREYPRGYIVSAGFRITSPGGAGWLRRASGAGTVSMDGVLPVKGLSLPDARIHVDYSAVDASGRPHARLYFAGEYSARVALWEAQKQHELLTGVFLADMLGINSSVPTALVDFHTILENYYGGRLLLLRPGLDAAPAAYRQRLDEFVAREKPLGSVMLVVTAAAQVPDVVFPVPSNGLVYNGEPLGYNGEPLVYTSGEDASLYNGIPFTYNGEPLRFG
jgi:hypothetical protein